MKITRSFSLTIPEKDIYEVLRLIHLIIDTADPPQAQPTEDEIMTVFFTLTGRDGVVNEKYRKLRRLSRGKPGFKIETSVWVRGYDL